MSVTTEPRQTPDRSPAPTDAQPSCPQCGAPLSEDQEWCLECGNARTLIRSPPDWRVPVAIVGLVIALVLAGFVIALVNVSSDANRSASVQIVSTAPVLHPAATAPAARAAPPSVAAGKLFPHWPTGLGGWTIALASTRSHAAARAVARRIAVTGMAVGILHSTRHPSMTPGFWVVFLGHYPTEAAAQAQATALLARGLAGARALLVGPPGA